MKKSFYRLSIYFILVTLTACGGAGRKERSRFLKQFQAGQYDAALSYLETNKFYKEEASRLLYFLEKGSLLHVMGQYRNSVLALEKAKDLSRKLYTVSISGKLKSALANDSYDKYYGESYERSLIHFYLALNHFLLYQKGEYEPATKGAAPKKLSAQERRSELMSARAEIAAWDSMLTTLRNAKGGGKSVFKNDLLAKTFGAYIHEAVGSRNDDQTALQLYKDAKDLLFKNYNSYRAFNNSHQKFKKDFVDLKKMRLSDVASKYVSGTSFQKNLKNFLDFKILSLTKKIRPNEYKRQLKIHSPASSVVTRLDNAKRANVGVVFQRGMIAPKIADKHYYGLGAVLEDPDSSKGAKAMAAIGSAVFAVFAAKQLGLLPPPTTYAPGKAYVGIKVAEVAVRGVAVKFEMPKIVSRPVKEATTLNVLDGSGAVVHSQELVLINPLGDIAQQAVAESAASRYARTGLRVAGKHAAAIAAAYATYKVTAKKNKFFAKIAAVATYAIASKGIEASEKADTRQWSSLPGDLRFADLHLDKGKYKLQVLVQGPGKGVPKTYNVGKLDITDAKKKYLVNYRSKN